MQKLRYIFLILLVIPPLFGRAMDCDTIYSIKDSLVVPPYYEGGISAQMRFNNEVVKPAPVYSGGKDAKARILLSFDVDKNGNTCNPTALRIVRIYNDEYDEYFKKNDPYWEDNIDKEFCKEEAFRILSMMKFSPAMKDEKTVCFKGAITFIFVYYAASAYD